MATLNLRTLVIAIELVEAELASLHEHLRTLDEVSEEHAKEDHAMYSELLLTIELAARDLENAYREQQQGVINYPDYDTLIARNSN